MQIALVAACIRAKRKLASDTFRHKPLIFKGVKSNSGLAQRVQYERQSNVTRRMTLMIKPVSLLSSGFALAALAAMQMPAAEPQAHQYEPTPQVSTQRVQYAEKAQITTLSATQGSTLAQPQRWVF